MATEDEGWDVVTDEDGWTVVTGAAPEGSDEARRVRGAEEKARMDEAIRQARLAALSPYERNIMPYSSRQFAETGYAPDLISDPLGAIASSTGDVSTYQDMFSLPARLISTAGSPEWMQAGVTSEEYDNLIPQLLTSPVTGAAAIAAPFAPAAAALLPASAPAWAAPLAMGGYEAGIATGAGALMDPTYGGTDAAIDAATSLVLPIAGPWVRTLAKSKAKSRIAKILTDNGADASPEIVDRVYDRVVNRPPLAGEGEQLGEDLRTAALSDLAKDMDPQTFLKSSWAQDEVISDIKSSLSSKATLYGKRSIEEADRDIARAKDFFRKQNMLEDLVKNNSIPREEFQGHLTDLLKEYSDIPELMDVVKTTYSQSNFPAIDITSQMTPDAQDASRYKLDWDQVMGRMKAGDIVSSGAIEPITPFSMESPFSSTMGKAGSYIKAKGLPLAGLGSESLRFLPQLQRYLTEEEQ